MFRKFAYATPAALAGYMYYDYYDNTHYMQQQLEMREDLLKNRWVLEQDCGSLAEPLPKDDPNLVRCVNMKVKIIQTEIDVIKRWQDQSVMTRLTSVPLIKAMPKTWN